MKRVKNIDAAINSMLERFRPGGLDITSLIAALASGFFFSSALAVLRAEHNVMTGIQGAASFFDIAFVNNVNLPAFIFAVIAFSAAVFCVGMILKSRAAVSFNLLLTSVFFSVSVAVIYETRNYEKSRQTDVAFMIGVAVLLIIILKYLSDGDKLRLAKISGLGFFSSRRTMYVFTAVCAAIFAAALTVVSYSHYLSFGSFTFDFGIFAQMFERMKATGLPLTTCERGAELSHFAVHFSPTWYLLLPGYMLFGSPLYLFAAHAVLVALGAFPVYRIAGKLGASPLTSFAFSLMYLFFPTMAASSFVDIHENSFLPVLILYTVYFFLSGKYVPMFIFALLTLGDKEDAAIYMIALALYIIFATKKKTSGAVLLLLSCGYFVFATHMIVRFGGTVMSSRLGAYYPQKDAGLLSVIKTCITDAGYFIVKVFGFDASEPAKAQSALSLFSQSKLQFVIWLLLPVLFAPFLSKKNSVLFLLVPMLVINLMPDWIYQYNAYYQYTYGPAAMIVFACMAAVLSMSAEKRRFFVSVALTLCFVFSAALTAPKVYNYGYGYLKGRAGYTAMQDTIDDFFEEYYKEGDSVSATTTLLPHCSKVKELYDVPDQYGGQKKTDWYILDSRYYYSDDYFPEDILKEYTLINPDDGSSVEIFRRTES